MSTRSLLRIHKCVHGLRSAIGRRALRYGVAATLEHQAMLRRIEPAFVVDVGANRGQFALDVLAAVPGAQILSVEPLPRAAATYRRVFSGEERVELIEIGISDSDGRRLLHIAGHDDSSSLHFPTATQISAFPGTGATGSEAVEVLTLDSLLVGRRIPERSLLKIDVQGHELSVLQGAKTTLATFRWIYAEVSFVEFYEGQPLAAEVVAYLGAHGFSIADLGEPVRRLGRAVQIDMLFERHPSTG